MVIIRRWRNWTQEAATRQILYFRSDWICQVVFSLIGPLFLSITTLKSAWSEKEADLCFKVCLKSINHFEIDHDIASNPTRKSYTTTSLRKTELGSCSWSGFRSTITTQHRRFKRLRIRVRKTFFFNLKVFFKLRFYNF